MLDRKVCMKIQTRAGLEVVAGTAGLVVALILFNAGLEYVLETYGLKGMLIGLGIAVMLLFMNLVYKIRVSQLKFEENWKKTVDQ